MQGLSEEGCSTLLYRLPAMVPPVPAPQTNASTLCPLCCHISSPVFRWARKLARFSNWLANMLLGVAAALRLATLTKWSGCVMDTGLTFSTWAPVLCCLSGADQQARSKLKIAPTLDYPFSTAGLPSFDSWTTQFRQLDYPFEA